jgi:hypothetical protein
MTVVPLKDSGFLFSDFCRINFELKPICGAHHQIELVKQNGEH